MKFIDRERVDKKQFNKTEEGFIKEKVTIARIGSMEYLGSELGDGHKPDQMYQVYVEKDELFSDATIQSLEGKDSTIEHPNALEVTLDSQKSLSVGHVQNIYADGDYLKGTIFIKDKDAIESIEKNGLKEVSLGYSSDIIEKDGKLVKTNIRANHLAIVTEGRCGSACKIGDSKKAVKKMTVKKKKGLSFGDKAMLRLGKTARNKVIAKKFGDTRKGIENAKTKLGDSALKKLSDAEDIITNPDSTDEEKQAAIEAIASVSEDIQEAVALLEGAEDSTDEAETAVEEIPVTDAEGDPTEVETITRLQEENTALREENEKLREDVKNLSEEVERIKGERDRNDTVNDAKAKFPKAKIGDSATAREAKEAALVYKRKYTADGVKVLTDCAIDSEYSKLSAEAINAKSNFGAKILGDNKAKALTASQRMGGK